MLRLQRHQHIFTTSEGELVSSTIIPFGPADHEAITLHSLAFLMSLPVETIKVMTDEFAVNIEPRNAQEWIAVEDAMRLFDLRTRT